MVHVLSVLNFRNRSPKAFFFTACRNVLFAPVSNLAGYRVLPMDRSKFDFHPALIIKEELVMPDGDDF
jgi:hypothetical protein